MRSLVRFSLVLSFLVFLQFTATAQQDPMYSMYMFNGLAINPAYAGSRERPAITALYRNQWSGLEGAPKTAVLVGHAPLNNDRSGIGASLIHDKISVFNTIQFKFNYAYRIPVGKAGRLSMGISAEVNNFRANWTEVKITDATDYVFTSGPNNIISPNFGAGLYYYTNRFYTGVSIPHFLNTSLTENFNLEGTNMTARQWKHYFFTIGGVAKLNDKVKFKPSVLIKYVRNAPVQADINMAFLFNEAFWIGASYRTGDAVNLMTEYVFSKGLRIGYSYDITLSELSNYSSGTHEIMLGFEFMKKDTYLSPRRMSYF